MLMREYECQLAQEELGEVIDECLQAQKRISKMQRFGPDEIMVGAEKNNSERLRDEMLDFLICVRFLESRGMIRPITWDDVVVAYHERRQKIVSNLQRSINELRVDARTIATVGVDFDDLAENEMQRIDGAFTL